MIQSLHQVDKVMDPFQSATHTQCCVFYYHVICCMKAGPDRLLFHTPLGGKKNKSMTQNCKINTNERTQTGPPLHCKKHVLFETLHQQTKKKTGRSGEVKKKKHWKGDMLCFLEASNSGKKKKLETNPVGGSENSCC